jgi:predicted RNase H-like HicB family nuclease
MGKQYTVSDGKMMLILEEAEEGGFVVTSPIDPGLVTQAETLQEAFQMAYDAAECLAVGRKLMAERMGFAVAEAVSADDAGPASEPHEGRSKSRRKARANGIDAE